MRQRIHDALTTLHRFRAAVTFERICNRLSPRWSAALLFIVCVLTCIRINKYGWLDALLRSDAKGYYQYLPEFFINGDLTILPLSIKLENGNHLSFFQMGVAILEMPFFFLGHLITLLLGTDASGYTDIYAFSVLGGTIIYVCIGICFLQKTLELRWNRMVAISTLCCIFFGTNLYFYTCRAGTMSHAYSFFLFSLFIYFSIQYHRSPSIKSAAVIGVLAGLVLLIKPNNLIISLFFIFYGLSSWRDIKERFWFFLWRFQDVLSVLIIITLCVLPQLAYWHLVSGKWIIFAYGMRDDNEFFWKTPKLIQVLVHPQNGWLLYSPIIVFALYSLVRGAIKNTPNYRLILAIWVIAWYVFSSWWCWWFGSAFGHRAFVEYLPLMAIPLAEFIDQLKTKKKWWRYSLVIVILLFIYMSLKMTFIYSSPWDGPDWYWDDYFRILRQIF